jgi:hypothetical protein
MTIDFSKDSTLKLKKKNTFMDRSIKTGIKDKKVIKSEIGQMRRQTSFIPNEIEGKA